MMLMMRGELGGAAGTADSNSSQRLFKAISDGQPCVPSAVGQARKLLWK
jgi:hypothetical protein